MTDLEKAEMLWCTYQGIDENKEIVCLAHLDSGRVLNCPYKTKEARMKAAFPCSDCEEVEKQNPQ